MAKMIVPNLDGLHEPFKELERKAPEAIGKAIYAGADVAIKIVKEELRKAIKEPTGGLESALGISKMRTDEDNGKNVKIGFDGYDEKGVPYAMIARVLESGRSDQQRKKTRFLTKSIKRASIDSVEIMEKIFLSTINEIR